MTSTVEPPVSGFAASPALSGVVVPLLKGVVYRENDATLWNALVHGQARVRDYVAVLGLELALDEAEGHAFLRSRPDGEAPAPGEAGAGEASDDGSRAPRLVVRRPLSFPVSLLLALLRRKLAELDAGGGDTRLVLTRDDIVEMVRLFLPDTSNEARLVDRIDTHLNRVVELGFLRRMKSGAGAPAGAGAGTTFEVRRILKAFVDAQWLAEFDTRLAAYRALVEGGDDRGDDGNGGDRGGGDRRGGDGGSGTNGGERERVGGNGARARPIDKNKGNSGNRDNG